MKLECIAVGAMQVNCYLVWDENEKKAIVIDPGDNASKITDKLNEHGLKCAAILLTHGHFDHITGVNELKEITKAQIYAGRDEDQLLKDSDLNVSKRIRRPVCVNPDILLNDMEITEIAELSFKTIFTPGHTRGSVCFYFEKEKVLFTGDTLFNSGMGRTDLPTGNEAALYSSIKHRIMTLPGDTKCFPGHGEATDIASEGKYFGN